jgi:hypothetical protein
MRNIDRITCRTSVFWCVLLACGVLTARADLQNAAYQSDATATNQYSGSWTAAHAVNEVTGGEGWHSLNGTVDPWWQTDLGAMIPIDSLLIQARSGFISRINGCSVAVYPSADATGVAVYSNVVTIRSGENLVFDMPAGTVGRSVKVSYAGIHPQGSVNLSEVFVYSENLARGKPATMSTTWGGGSGPWKVVDGTRPANFPEIAHSSGGDANPWLKIDLEGVCAVDSVRLWNRTANMDRLADYNIQVLADDDSTVLYDYKVVNGGLINPGNAMGSPTVITVDLQGNAAYGRYINVIRELPAGGNNVLQLSEVEVFGSGLVEGRAATDITSSSATLNGFVHATNTNTSVTVYWGETDAGTNWTQWAETNVLGVSAAGTGSVSQAISGMTVDTAYSYRFRASNSGGSGHATGSGQFRTIGVSSGMIAWYTASGLNLTNAESIAAISDASPEGYYDLAQGSGTAQPTFHTNIFNGHPALSFDGSDHIWSGDLQQGWPSNNLTLFFVTKADILTGNEFYRANPNDNTDRFLTHYAYAYGNTYFDFGNISANGRLQWANADVFSTNLLCYWQEAGTGQRAYRNGASLNSDGNTSTFSVHGYQWLLGNGYQGDIGEMLIYNRPLSDFEQTVVSYFLLQKYGITNPYAQLDNADGATAVNATDATANGTLYWTDGGESTVVKVLWGTSDGGGAFGAWDATTTVATVTSEQQLSEVLPGLSSAQTYYYRFYASNAVSGSVWADSTEVFKTDFMAAPTNIALWLAADSIPGVTNAGNVAQWPDLSGNARHAAQATVGSQPQFLTNVVNGMPVVRNTSGKTLTLTESIATVGKTIVMVYEQDAGQTAWTLALGNNLHTTQNNGTFCMTRSGGAIAVSSTVSSKQFGISVLQMVNGDYRLWVNGAGFGPDTRSSTFTPISAVGNGFLGDFAEIIVFEGTLDQAGHREVGRYLAEKYGIGAGYNKVDLPTAIDDPVIWYDLDSEIGLSDGATIGTLHDFSWNNIPGTSQATANYPTYVTNVPSAFGGKPVVRFSGHDDNWFAFTERGDVRTIFWVINEDAGTSSGNRFILGDDNTYHFHRSGVVNGPFWHGTHAHANIRNGETTVDGMVINGQVDNVPTTPSIIAVRTVGNVNASRLMQDRGIGGRTWDGDMAELLVYNRALTDAEVGQVGYYLESKYGLSTEYGLVDNAGGATNITSTSAHLNGRLNANSSGASTAVKVFWGTSDGGAVLGAWQNTNTVATVTGPGAFSYAASALKSGRTYFYRYYASNAVSGGVWAESTSVFGTDFMLATNSVELWLSADSIRGLSNGDPVERWTDLSGYGRDALQTTPASQPEYVTAVLGGEAVVRCASGETMRLLSNVAANGRTMVLVHKQDMSQTAWTTALGNNLHTTSDAGVHAHTRSGGAFNIQSSVTSKQFTYNVHQMIVGSQAYWVDGTSIGSSGNASTLNAMTQIGAGFLGDFAEIIVFDGILDSDAQMELGNYLEFKYGLDTVYSRVDNSGGATGVTATGATLNGRVYHTDGGEDTVVRVLWGESDGADVAAAWGSTTTVSTITTTQTVSQVIGGLKGGRTYFYRYSVSNSVSGLVLADATTAFKTPFQTQVGDAVLWLAADAIPGITNTESVARWPDLSPNKYDATQATPASQPQFLTGIVGGQPAVNFGGSHLLNMGSLPANWPTTRATIYVVVQHDNTSQQTWALTAQPVNTSRFNLHLPWSNNVYWDFGNISAGGRVDCAHDGGTTWNLWAFQRSATGMWIRRNGVEKAAKTGGQTFNAAGGYTLRLGENVQGDFAEVIVFNDELDAAAQAELGNYLELKYGLSTPHVQVDNGIGASAVGQTNATLNGHVYYTQGGESTEVKVLWGTSDGGAAFGAWGNTATVATVTSPQGVSQALSGLTGSTLYYYRMYASNAVSGGVWAESTAVFETKFSSVNSGLELWLDSDYFSGTADGAAVGYWQDFSGNSNHASQGNGTLQPLFYTNAVGGKAVVRFDGTDDYMDGPANNLEAQTVFMVLKVEADAPGLSGVFSRKGADNQNIRTQTATTWRAPGNGANEAGDFCYGGAAYVNGSGYAHNNQYHILEELSDDIPSMQYRISQTLYSRYFKGDLAEVIIYNRTLTADERREVGRYLMGKYNIAAAYGKYDLPQGTTDPVIWYDMDSQPTLADGQTVSTLFDFSGNNANGNSQATANYPTYRTNAPSAFGGKPVVRFTGHDDNWFNFAERGDIRTVFWVIKEDVGVTGGPRPLLGDNNTYHFHRSDPPNKAMWHGTHAHANVKNGDTAIDGLDVNGIYTDVPTTPSIIALRTTGNVNASRLVRDRSSTDRTWDGDLAELLIYNRALSDAEMARVGQYLEEKYSLTTVYGFVDNANGATNVTQTTAYLNGRLNGVDDGYPSQVTVYYGTADPGQTATGWDGSHTFAGAYSSVTSLTWQASGLSPATVYYYRFYASNGVRQAWADSAAVFETKLSVSSGLELWLDAQVINQANGSSVTRWLDMSDNALDAEQGTPTARPTLDTAGPNGRKTVSFDGGDSVITPTLPGTWPTTQCTMFIVQKNDTTAQNNNAVVAAPNDNANRFLTHNPHNSSGQVYWDFGNISAAGRLNYANDGGTIWNVWMFERSAAGMRICRNGATKTSKVGGSSFNPSGKTLELGGALQGDISEVIVYNRELSAAEQRELGVYLSSKYGVNAAFPKHTLPAVADDPVMWVDADAIEGLSDGDTVSTWYNLTGSDNNFAKGSSGNPVYKVNQLGGRPVVRFDGGINTYFAFNRISDINTVFWVIREDRDATGGRFLLGDGDLGSDTYHFHRGGNGEMWHGTYTSANIRNGTTRINGRVVNGTQTKMPTQYSVISLVTTGNVQANRFVKDRNIGPQARSWDGDLAELLIYNRALSDSEERAVGRYLQQKYSLQPTLFIIR